MNSCCWLILVVLFDASGRAAEAPRRDAHGDTLPSYAVARLGTSRLRHGAKITAVAYSPDGRTVASASFDHTVSLWDADNGRELVRYGGHTGEVRAVAFAPDGTTIASAGSDRKIRLWEVPRTFPASGVVTGKATTVLDPGSDVEALAFAPDGKTLAAGGDHLAFWELAGRKKIRNLTLDASVNSLAFHPSGKFLVVCCSDGTAGVREVATGSVVSTFRKQTIQCAVFSPDGKRLALGGYDNRVYLRDAFMPSEPVEPLAQGSKSGRFSFVFCVAFSPDGKTLASAGDGTVRLWDSQTGKAKDQLECHTERATAVAFAPDGRHIAAACGPTLRILNAGTLKETAAAGEPDNAVEGLSLASDGKTLAVVRAEGRFDLWDTALAKKRPLTADIEHWQGATRAAAFAPEGQVLAIGVSPGSLFMVDLKTEKATLIGEKNDTPLAPLVFQPDGRTILGGLNRLVVGRTLPEGKAIPTSDRKHDSLWCLAVAPDGRTRASGGGAMMIFLTRANGETQILDGHPGGVQTLAFFRDGRTLVSGGKDRLIRLWEVATGKQRKAFGGYAWTRAVACSPDGRLLASGGTDGVVRLWDCRSCRQMAEFTGHRGPVNAVVFSPDSRRLFSGAADTTVLAWDVAGVPGADGTSFKKEELEGLWNHLTERDAPGAFVAMQQLARAPAHVVTLIKERVPAIDPRRVATLLRNLDSDDFNTRERASAELAGFGKTIVPTLQKLRQGRASAEVKRRAAELVDRFEESETPVELLRGLRAIEVLQMIGTPEARRVLEKIAAGADGFELTTEARAAVKQMAKP